MTCFLFVGERPSPKAERIGATWHNAKLAGKTLRAALETNNIDPAACEYMNLWRGAYPTTGDAEGAREASAQAMRRQTVEGSSGPQTITVEVTAEDISEGLPDYISLCPVALAIKRRLATPYAKVDFGRMVINHHILPTPRSVRRFVDRFDKRRDVTPFAFRLPAWLSGEVTP